MNELHCSPEVEERLWTIRNLLYRAVQDTIPDQHTDDAAAVKQAYEEITTLLDELRSNLVRPDET